MDQLSQSSSNATGTSTPTPPLDEMISSSNGMGISKGEYANKVQKLIKLIDHLRSLGAEAVMNLPGITVIGNQSAGKSSLVEAISGISVPRNAQTCTRCPMECRLRYSQSTWSCQIYLRRKRDTSIESQSKRGASNNGSAREVSFGPLITEKTELEHMIRCAQLAILNPSIDASRFVSMTEKELNTNFSGNEGQLQFSEDVVCLDISGPDVTNLSFIDLPGIISNDDAKNVTTIENMVKEHIKGNTLILSTITMREDIQLQKAGKLAKDADPHGQRTIGVLTKPDTLQAGEEDVWYDILTGSGIQGEKNKLRHGHYITKQPALSELREKIDHTEARERERAYFANTHPWNTLPSKFRDRVGVRMLVHALSRLLSQLIEKSLPGLMTTASESLTKTQLALDTLPIPPPENPVIELSRLLTIFSTEVGRYVWGAQGYEEIAQCCRQTYSTFVANILTTRPNFVPYFKSGTDQDSKKSLVFETIEEAQGVKCKSEPMYLDAMHDFLEKSLTRELPFNVPFSAKAKLMKKCFEKWEFHCLLCFKVVKVEVEKRVFALVTEHFKQYSCGGLETYVRRIVEGEIKACAQATINRIKWLLELEDPPFTKNDYYFAQYRERYLAQYKEIQYKEIQHKESQCKESQKRRMVPLPSSSINLVSNSSNSNATAPNLPSGAPLLSSSSSVGFGKANAEPMQVDVTREAISNDVSRGPSLSGHVGKTEADLARLADAVPFEQELIVMAEVSAYFRVAYKRIIDNVPRIIDHDFLRALEQRLHGALNKGLGLGERDAYVRAERYLKEDRDITATREELKRKKERLEEIIENLERFSV